MKIAGKQLEKIYKGRRVVNKVDFEISQGEIVGLLGPNGAGKTTTFYMTTGLVRPNRGQVFFDDQEVTRWPMYRRARAGISYLPQEASVFRKLSVRDNLKLVLQLAKKNSRQINAKIDELAAELHIEKILNSSGNVLSGGERRRVEIARSLAIEPKFILLDEPFTGIDPVTIEEIQAILFKLKARGIGILITDHNVGATLRITDRNYILIDGQILAAGTSQEIAGNPMVRKHYLGEQFGTEIFADDIAAIEAAEGQARDDIAPTEGSEPIVD